MDLLSLYDFADEHQIEIDWFSMQRAKSLSIPLEAGRYGIALDPWKLPTLQDETCCIAHEIGHCMTGSFYSRDAACDVRQKHENRADKYAIHTMIPEEALHAAVAAGHTELWDLADYFGVTEDFMKKAICLYERGNVALD